MVTIQDVEDGVLGRMRNLLEKLEKLAPVKPDIKTAFEQLFQRYKAVLSVIAPEKVLGEQSKKTENAEKTVQPMSGMRNN